MTVYDNMAFGLQVNGVKPAEVEKKCALWPMCCS